MNFILKEGNPLTTPANKLIVYFKDGTVIPEKKGELLCLDVADVFEKAIEKIDPVRIYAKGGNLTSRGELLILNRQHSNYPTSSRRLSSGFYLNTNSSTEEKKQFLEEISDKLKLGLRVVLT